MGFKGEFRQREHLLALLACLSDNELRQIPKSERNRALQLVCILAA
jgi:hypothetical protein